MYPPTLAKALLRAGCVGGGLTKSFFFGGNNPNSKKLQVSVNSDSTNFRPINCVHFSLDSLEQTWM